VIAALLCAALAATPPISASLEAEALAASGDEGPPAPTAEIAAPPRSPLQLRIAALPLVSYGSNVGVQVGAALVFYKAPPTGGARRDWLAVGASWATRGPRSLELKGERFDLGATRLRAFYQAKISTDDLAPYWGEGAKLAPGDSAGTGSPPEAYRYRAIGPWLSTAIRGEVSPAEPWSPFGRVRFRWLDVQSPGSALATARPPGSDGGSLTMFHLGLLRDTRDEELSSSRGTLLDGSLFAAPAITALSDHELWGLNVGARAYHTIAPRVVVALRAMYDLKLGDVPFHERTQVEGLDYGEGLGGPDTIRGIARARLSGEQKMLGNLEVRAILTTVRPAGRPLELGVSGGADAGLARQRGHSPVTAAGVFGGLRAIWDRAVVVRLEAGFAGEGGVAYYLAFDESF
jgi:hypothetical protein